MATRVQTAGIFLLVLVATIPARCADEPKEPTYDGIALSTWMERLKHRDATVRAIAASLKRELTHHEKYTTRDEAKVSLFEYIEAFYNRVRRHSSLGYLSPEDLERTYNPKHP